MALPSTPQWFTSHLAEMSRVARDVRGVPEDVVRHAAVATARVFEDGRRLPNGATTRSEKYFWKVVRTRLLRARVPCSATAHLVIAAVVADLTESGRDASSVWNELERGWRDKVPAEVLEEYRGRLCA